MISSRVASRALCAAAAAAMLAACSGGGSAPLALAPATAGSSAAKTGSGAPMGQAGIVNKMDRKNHWLSMRAPKVHRDHKKSWMSPDVQGAPRLLFVSDAATGDVNVFTMPGMALKGQLTGFYQPQGECSNYKTGNIWVVDTGALSAYQFTRTGTLVSTVTATQGFPVGCAVNPVNGDVALTDIYGFEGAGGVEIFPGGSGSPTFVQNAGQYEYYFDGYDPSGNLYTDGWSPSFTFTVSEIPFGSNAASTINLAGGQIYFPGMVQWYGPGSYLAIGDQNCNGGFAGACIYPATISGSTATLGNPTVLSAYNGANTCDVVQAVISPQQKYVAGGDAQGCGYANTSADRWAYPAGSLPTNYYNGSSLVYPIGAAISNK